MVKNDLDLHPDAADEEEDDDMVEISEAEMDALRRGGEPDLHSLVDVVPASKDWSTPTFACHTNVASCLTALFCPFVQFGFNQRAALRSSCLLWALAWLFAIGSLYLVLHHLVPRPESGSAAEAVVGVAMAQVESGVTKIKGHLKKRGIKHGGLTAASAVVAPLDAAHGAARAQGHIWLYFFPLAMLVTGLLGMLRRRKLRQKYAIRGSVLADFVCHCCCHCCSLAKEAREITHQGLQARAYFPRLGSLQARLTPGPLRAAHALAGGRRPDGCGPEDAEHGPSLMARSGACRRSGRGARKTRPRNEYVVL